MEFILTLDLNKISGPCYGLSWLLLITQQVRARKSVKLSLPYLSLLITIFIWFNLQRFIKTIHWPLCDFLGICHTTLVFGLFQMHVVQFLLNLLAALRIIRRRMLDHSVNCFLHIATEKVPKITELKLIGENGTFTCISWCVSVPRRQRKRNTPTLGCSITVGEHVRQNTLAQ